jgi:hypothetical protein
MLCIDLQPDQDLPPPNDTTEPSGPGLIQEVPEVVTLEPGKDEIAEAVAAEEDEGDGEDDKAAYRRGAAEGVTNMVDSIRWADSPCPAHPASFPLGIQELHLRVSMHRWTRQLSRIRSFRREAEQVQQMRKKATVNIDYCF